MQFSKFVILVLISFSGYCQLNFSEAIFKKIETIETSRQKLNDSTNELYITEKNIDKYNKESKITENLRTTYYLGEIYESSKTVYYHDNNKIIYSTRSITKDSLSHKTNYYYEKNLLKKKWFHFKHNNITYTYTEEYFYNSKLKLKEKYYSYTETHIDTEKKKIDLKAKFTYNKNEHVIISDWTKSKGTYRNKKIIHIRNKRGLILKEKEFDENGKLLKIIRFNYTFDEKGNWISKQNFEDKTVTNTTYRQIEYY